MGNEVFFCFNFQSRMGVACQNPMQTSVRWGSRGQRPLDPNISQGSREPMVGIEPTTTVLPRLCATTAPHGLVKSRRNGGQWRIRTSEALATDLQSVPFDRFGNCPWSARQLILTDRRGLL